MPRSFAHAVRSAWGIPHGLPAFSRLRSIAPASEGNDASAITRLRRRSTIVSMCSMSTGHSCTQAPHVVHAQTTSSSITSGTSAVAWTSPPPSLAASSFGPSANR